MPPRRVICLLFCAVVVVPVSATADDRQCRTARLPPGIEWRTTTYPQSILTYKIDVDGDQKADLLDAEKYTSNLSDVTLVRLSLTKDEQVISVASETSNYWIVSVHAVPPEMTGAARTQARRLVEDVLFPATCSQPEGSLTWLVFGHETVRWQSGSPVLPENYAVYYETLPKSFVFDNGSKQDGGSSRDAPTGAVWVEYAGWAHDHPLSLSPAGREGRGFATLAETQRFKLLGTLHGVVALDKLQSRHAWIYVYAGGSKLGVGSIPEARLEGTRATIELLRFPQQAGTVEIDLASGAYAETWEARE